MKISMVGTGYVGLVSGTCFADLGNDVLCVDIDESKIASLSEGMCPFFEPGLSDKIKRNVAAGRLKFTTDLDLSVRHAEVFVIAVGTPSQADGRADVSAVLDVADRLIANLKKIPASEKFFKILVVKSTVPVGLCRQIEDRLTRESFGPDRVAVASNPEFLREGSAIEDFFRPDRIVLGSGSAHALEVLAKLYAPLYRNETVAIKTSLESAELSKYASNAFLATKISFINEMANLCDRFGADVRDIARIMGADGRIGRHFLHPGPGYGGSCFPKDTTALVRIAEDAGYDLKIVRSAEEVNTRQKHLAMEKAMTFFGGDLRGKIFAVLGLAFKPETDDVREAPAIAIIQELLKSGAKIQAHDPEAAANARIVLGDKITYAEDAYRAAEGADAVVLVTEWHSFRQLDLHAIKKNMKKTPVFFDLRNLYSPEQLKSAGFEYYVIGRGQSRSK